jgi:hypothetical protein
MVHGADGPAGRASQLFMNDQDDTPEARLPEPIISFPMCINPRGFYIFILENY